MKRIFWIGLWTTLLLGSCAQDEGMASDDNGNNKPLGDQAYMTIRIADAGVNTRAERDFDYGTTDEQSVNDARFFFYDANGIFVTEASVWGSGTPVTSENGQADGNVEFNGNTVIVLNGLTGKGYPKYLVTALNAPTTFTPASTLTELLTEETDVNGGIYKDPSGTTKRFIMSTTSYKRTDDVPYYVTEIKDTDLQPGPVSGTASNPVTVYVERLAAKVTLQLSSNFTPTADKNNRYKLTVTVAGADNDNVTGSNPPMGAEEIYIEFVGWGLNATAKDSYLLKNINAAWSSETSGLGFNWNDATNYRSYWGMSYNYNDAATAYPDKAAGITTSCKLNYISANDISNSTINTTGTSQYCAENTFPATIAAKLSARTSILLKAKIYDKDNNTPDLVRYRGVLWQQADYINYVLNSLNHATTGGISNYRYLKSGTHGEETAVYSQLDATCVELQHTGDGEVIVQLKMKDSAIEGKKEPLTTIYLKTESGYTPLDETGVTTLQGLLSAFNSTNKANGYQGGLMYYNIPIEHLRTITTGQTDVKEGNYGVVRNHHYVVTINKLENIGKGIFDPDEDIVPGDTEDDTYYLGTNIKILSWKIVEQNVDL